MSLEKIYVVRHGFRTSWSVDHRTGTYSLSIPSPTGIPVDPALTAHGVDQARELAAHLARLEPPVGVVYSSPYYRCLQTIAPFTRLAAQKDHLARHEPQGQQSQHEPQGQQAQHEPQDPQTQKGQQATPACSIRPEYGLCEWFGAAPFPHPGPAPPDVLRAMFPAWDASYQTLVRPPPRGETTAQLRRRVEDTVAGIVARCDADGVRSAVLCTHAAVVIMLGRVLTGLGPGGTESSSPLSSGTASSSAASEDAEFDFDAFTCGLSIYRRRKGAAAEDEKDREKKTNEEHSPAAAQGAGRAHLGTWECEANSDCSFLSHGAERGWKFSGDEDFPDTGSLDNSPPKL